MKNKVFLLCLAGAMCLTACYHQPSTPRGSFAKGADVSWLSEMEHDGVKFYNVQGDNVQCTRGGDCLEIINVQGDNVQCTKEGDCLEIMQGIGMNAVRLRVWVNHSTGWSNKADVVRMAKRAAKQGLRVMIDFHYSDFFADPSHQEIPAAWKGYSYEQLCEAVREHTLDVLYALKEAGVQPEWVQVGNETPNGMLWPVGRVIDLSSPQDTTHAPLANHWDEYAGLTASGYKAVKEAFPDAQVIVHVDNAFMYRDWFFRAMEEHGGRFDMIGLSHYPMMSAWSGIPWQEANRRAEENIRALIATFHRPVMIAEIGMMNWGEGAVYDSVAATSQAVMADFLTRIADIDSCAGVFYWEPQVYGGWKPAEYVPLGWGGYDMGSFTPEGQPSPVLKTLMGWSQSDVK